MDQLCQLAIQELGELHFLTKPVIVQYGTMHVQCSMIMVLVVLCWTLHRMIPLSMQLRFKIWMKPN